MCVCAPFTFHIYAPLYFGNYTYIPLIIYTYTFMPFTSHTYAPTFSGKYTCIPLSRSCIHIYNSHF